MTSGSDRLMRPQRQFYLSGPRPCPYLYGQVERSIFTELAGGEAGRLYEVLLKSGFRRSHQVAFRPACPDCMACVPVRIDVAGFAPKPWTRRILKANADLAAKERAPRATAEQYAVFRRYIATRHADGEMALMGFDDYRSMVEDSPIHSLVVEFREPKGALAAACLADRLSDGYSAVYSFFNPAPGRPSLGSLMILWLVEAARRQGLPYVYLGYWVEGSRKMAYKTRFRPLEALGRDGWKRLEDKA